MSSTRNQEEIGNLAVTNPDLAAKWHPTKNGTLSPFNVTFGSTKSVWWQCSLNPSHEWEEKVQNISRVKKHCPFCSGKKLHISNCLATVRPDLAKDWHPTKNSGLSPFNVLPKERRVIWWVCHRGHEYETKLFLRERGVGCSYCAGKKVTLEESVGKKYPDLLKEWHPTKNKKTLYDFAAGSGQKIWWICQKRHEWKTSISNRTFHKSKCPYCAGKKPTNDNCLGSTHPEVAMEWHPAKNGALRPSDFIAGNRKRVWWQCRVNPKHTWEASITNRAKHKSKCLICTGRITTPGTCLAATHPEISIEWHSTKNGNLTSKDVLSNSTKKVWWQCRVIPEHIWEAKINIRVGRGGKHPRKGTACPECRPQISDAEYRLAAELLLIFPDLQQKKKIEKKEADIFIPQLKLVIELDGAYYHAKRLKQDIKKNEHFEKLGYRVVRLRGNGLPLLSTHDSPFDCKQITIKDIQCLFQKIVGLYSGNLKISQKEKLTAYQGETEFCNEDKYSENLTALPGKINGANLKDKRPELEKEWHPTKNGSRLPEHYTIKSGQTIWWECSKNMKHPPYASKIADRAIGNGCPYCANKRVWKGNCLATKNPELALEWDHKKNKEIRNGKNILVAPEDVITGSNTKRWWKCKEGHSWDCSPDIRHREKAACPICLGRRVDPSNCLATVNPQLSKEWHPTKNDKTPSEVTRGSKYKAWWICQKGHDYPRPVYLRSKGKGCTVCSGRRVDPSNCLATVNPELAKEWHPTKNNKTTLEVTRGSKNRAWWVCPQGHEYQSLILSRSHGHGCLECSREIKRETANRRWAKHRRHLAM